MKEYFKLLKFVRPYLGNFVLAGVLMVLSALFDGASLGMIVPLSDKILTNKKIIIPAKLPVFLSKWVDQLNTFSPRQMLNYLSVAIIALFFLKGVVGFLQNYVMSDIGQKVVRDIRAKLFSKLQQLSLDYFTHKRGGELISRITNDVKLVENAVSYGSTNLIYETAQVILFTFLVFYIHPRLALTVLALFPLISLPIIKVGKVLRKLSHKSQERMADINSILYETTLGTRIIKAFNLQDYEVAKFQRVNRDYYKISMKSIKRLLILSPFTEFLGCLAGIFVFYWGGQEVIAGKLSFGVFGLFLGSLFSLVRPFKKLSQVNSINQQAMAASSRIHEVLETSPSVLERPQAGVLSGFNVEVVFQDVYFNYGAQPVLKGINLRVKKGEMLAIVGPSGSGKTTLVDLIPRFYDPGQGQVLIDGTDIRGLTLQSLRRHIGLVTQETILFNDTIMANIAYGNLSARPEAVEQAAKQASAHEFISRLPLGYQTVIGDRGMRLSGGERQRLAIARALLKDPPILILDEATSQLDSQSERLVQEALSRLVAGRTVFVIAHRLSTVRNAQRIIVLSKGQILEQGSHEELVQRQGLYYKLYQMQELGE
jgi:subfamily B ATP-binding cassette protein MsbA